MLKIVKVLNSSVVLVEDEDKKEYIIFGKGIGYGKKRGNIVERQSADQFFMPVDDTRVQEVVEMLNAIPPVFLEITQNIIEHAKTVLDATFNNNIYFVLMDHLYFSVQRIKKGMVITNKVFWEIKTYYPKEFSIGLYGIELIEKKLNLILPEEEAANIAFHLVNAQSKDIDYRESMQAAKLIDVVVNIVKYILKLDFADEDIHYQRFIIHLKFFAERFFTGKMLNNEDDILFLQMSTHYPKAMACAMKIKDYINQHYKKELSNEEIAYLAIHIHRLLSKD